MNNAQELIAKGELEGVVITDDDLRDSWTPTRTELEEMDDNDAAMLAGHLFTRLTQVKADNQHCSAYDHDEQIWEGFVNEFCWTIEKYDDDYLVSFGETK